MVEAAPTGLSCHDEEAEDRPLHGRAKEYYGAIARRAVRIPTVSGAAD